MLKIEKNISAFLASHETSLPAATSFDGMRVEQFRQRLARHAQESDAPEPVGHFEGLKQAFRQLGHFIGDHQKASLAAAMAVIMAVLLFTDALNTRVSADTILTHSEVFEKAHQPSSGEVARVSIRMERISRSQHTSQNLGTVTVIREAERPVLESLESESGPQVTADAASNKLLDALFADEPGKTSLLQYLGAQGWSPDVSAVSFHQLISGRNDGQTTVRRNAGEYELRYPFAAGHFSHITEATLTVSDSDYSPSAIGLVLDGEREYRFTRSEEKVEPRSEEPLLLASSSLAPGSLPHASSPGLSQAPTKRAVPLSYQNSVASEQEVAAAEALHRADACLGEEVYLFPMSDGSLLVQGLVDSTARRDAIRQELRSVAGRLQVQVYLPRELRSGSELYNPPDAFEDKATGTSATATTTLADFSNAHMPLYDRLFKHFAAPGADPDATDKQVAMFSSEVVNAAQQAFLHAWALKRLDREFSEARTAGLPASALGVIDQLRQDHRRWIASFARKQTDMLAAVADPSLSRGASGLAEAKQSDADLLRLAQEQNDLVRALFTTSQPTSEPETVLSRLMTLLHRMGS
jgi:hypothetical protein